jgi:hypothetical protein
LPFWLRWTGDACNSILLDPMKGTVYTEALALQVPCWPPALIIVEDTVGTVSAEALALWVPRWPPALVIVEDTVGAVSAEALALQVPHWLVLEGPVWSWSFNQMLTDWDQNWFCHSQFLDRTRPDLTRLVLSVQFWSIDQSAPVQQ